MEKTTPPIYVEHEGTIRVAGISRPLLLAQCAQALITNGVPVIEFFFIGANAGHQAAKAMTILAYQIEQEHKGRVTATFRPCRYLTITHEGQVPKEKDASVWKLFLLEDGVPK